MTPRGACLQADLQIAPRRSEASTKEDFGVIKEGLSSLKNCNGDVWILRKATSHGQTGRLNRS